MRSFPMVGTMSKLAVETVSRTTRPTIDATGEALLQALAPWRPQAFSLHDSTGEVLWLSAGAIGPDEHSLALAALDVFALELQRSCIHPNLQDHRPASFLSA